MNRQDKINDLAHMLVIQGTCGLPLRFSDVAKRVADHPDFEGFLWGVMNASPAVMQYFVVQRARELVDDFLPIEDFEDA